MRARRMDGFAFIPGGPKDAALSGFLAREGKDPQSHGKKGRKPKKTRCGRAYALDALGM